MGERLVGFDRETVVAVDGDLARWDVQRERVTTGELAHVFDERTRGRYEPVGEELLQRRVIDRSWYLGVVQQAVQLAGEGEDPARGVVEERLFPEAVARQEHPPAPPVDDREREHAVELGRQVAAPFLIAVSQDFGVGVDRPEAMAEAFKVPPQLLMVVDLAVERHADLAILVPHRLAAAGKVEDGQASMRQMDRKLGVEVITDAVGTTVGQRIRHSLEVAT